MKRVKAAVFPGGAESTTALLGGHVDAVNTAPGNMVAHFKAGKLRPAGDFFTATSWRGVFSRAHVEGAGRKCGVFELGRRSDGPRGMTAEQIALWDRVFAALVKTDEWKKDLQENFWDEGYADAKSTRKRLDDYVRGIQGDTHRAWRCQVRIPEVVRSAARSVWRGRRAYEVVINSASRERLRSSS